MGIKVFIARILFSGAILLFPSVHAMAQDDACTIAEGHCAFDLLEKEAGHISETVWRDQIYRELAKLLAAEGRTDDAIPLIDRIETPDTKAMTIRGIGMAVAELDWDKTRYNSLFKALRVEAEKITHPPSYAIALTYIAMAQAFAGDNEGSWKTAADMANDALRHKAYGETAEIQAEHGDAKSAMKSIGFIDSEAYRNKSYSTIAHILADDAHYEEALQAAIPINNAYKKAQTILYILDKKRFEDLNQKLKKEEQTFD